MTETLGDFQPIPSPEKPPVVPKILTISTPEEQHLPYRIDIDPHKTGAFMKSLGMTDKQIQDTTLTIAYETRGLAKLGKPLHPLGYVAFSFARPGLAKLSLLIN